MGTDKEVLLTQEGYNNIEKERNNLCYSALFQMFAFIS